jgi:hypothetical protein
MSTPKYALTGELGGSPQPLALTKRATFFLEELLAAGSEGITTIDYPGVRVGDAVHKLRKAGVDIETQYEQHGGEFAGHHGRYVLRSKVARLDNPGAADAAKPGRHVTIDVLGANARIQCKPFLASLLVEAVRGGPQEAHHVHETQNREHAEDDAWLPF